MPAGTSGAGVSAGPNCNTLKAAIDTLRWGTPHRRHRRVESTPAHVDERALVSSAVRSDQAYLRVQAGPVVRATATRGTRAPSTSPSLVCGRLTPRRASPSPIR